MTPEPLRLEDFEVRKAFGPSPWRVYHIPTDRHVSIPQSATLHDGRSMPYSGAASFKRRRDAEAWVREELPILVSEYNARRLPLNEASAS